MKNKSVARRPDYIAFRVPEGGRFLALIAAIRPGRMPVPYVGVSDFFSTSPLV